MQLMRDVLLRLELARFAAGVCLDVFQDNVHWLTGPASIKQSPVAEAPS